MNGIQATRLALLLALLLTGAAGDVRAQAAGSREQHVQVEREQFRRIEEAQRVLERATREFYDRQAAFSRESSASQRDSLVQSRAQLERARANLNRELMELMVSSARAGAAMQPARVRMHALGADTMVFFQPVQPRGWLGVSFSTRWQEEVDAQGRSVWRFGAYPVIETVDPGSPAERAGLVAGDVLVTFGGHDVVRGTPPVFELLRPGAVLPIQVRRGDRLHSVSARIVARPHSYAIVSTTPATPGAPGAVRVITRGDAHGNVSASASGPPRAGAVERVRLVPVPAAGGSALSVVAGAEVFPIGAQFQQTLGVSEGLLVLRVAPGTPSSRAGIRTGDVIVAVGGKSIANAEALRTMLEAESSRSAAVQLVRDGTRRTVPLRW